MHEPEAMGLVERLGDLTAEAEHIRDGERTLLESRGEGLAFEMLHDQVIDVPLSADVMEGADVRVIEIRDGARLALEALARRCARGEL